ncbi:hypothetical protein HLK59_42025 [Streptomyces sp. S3(2020)]|uniref:hypothetical protein n=1 Tax=Streptomyces sp. S3(2020) TaxID=2732044 RepID=UPI00148A057E|nr:hypothetical protein [Streptomyces sp. S3(2020)]NNN36821.1 hypothetical protein [Streptomyces sp. S3(2020)]
MTRPCQVRGRPVEDGSGVVDGRSVGPGVVVASGDGGTVSVAVSVVVMVTVLVGRVAVGDVMAAGRPRKPRSSGARPSPPVIRAARTALPLGGRGASVGGSGRAGWRAMGEGVGTSSDARSLRMGP